MSRPNMQEQIACELVRAIRALGADDELLAIIGSYGDTLDDDDVLMLLKDWNARQKDS